MLSEQIRQKFFDFFEKRGHKIVSSSSLIPDDPSVLLTTAGMQQFRPYLTGKINPLKDFGSKNVFSIQKSFRTTDIEEVGDYSHLTLFEMVGNFSFGGYFKERAIALSFEFITSKEGLGFDCRKIFVTAFQGDNEIPRDDEAIRLWQEQFETVGINARVGEQIFLYGREKNWWEAGLGPSGPCAEMFYDLGAPHDEKFGQICHPNCDCGRFIEIGNDVFVQYNKISENKYEPLAQPAIDNGRGFERLVMIIQGKKNVFETDIFQPLISKIRELVLPVLEDKIIRILADHLRSSIFLIADGVRPSNKEAGYILRRLLRRILAYSIKYDIYADLFPESVDFMKAKFGKFYPELNDEKIILAVLEEERLKFQEAIGRGLKEMEKYDVIGAKEAFYLYETFGLPYELIKELAGQKIKNLNKGDFEKEFVKEFAREFERHQEISRAGAEKKFGGHGLVLNTGELKAVNEEEMKKVIRLHTAMHLLQWALREVLGRDVRQTGSDINSERLRFDFSFNRKMTAEEIKKVEDLANDKIKENLPVYFKEMPKSDAEKIGALAFFKAKYPDVVRVYFIGHSADLGQASISQEFCGGPHVNNTSEIGRFKILKEEAVAAGIRRIRAIVE